MVAFSISFIGWPIFFADWLFENGHELIGVISLIMGVMGFSMIFLILHAFLGNSSKIVKNTSVPYRSFLTEEEFLILKSLLSNKEIKNLDNVGEIVERKLSEVNKKFIEEDVLKEFHAHLMENKEAFDKYISFFKECLSEFNKTHNWRANEVEKVNAELKAAGLRSFEVEDKTLKLIIEESE